MITVQVLIILFSPSFSSFNKSITITLSGLASQDTVGVWGPSDAKNGTAWLSPPNSSQIRVMTDYSLKSAQPINKGLTPLRFAFNLTKHYDAANIKPVSSATLSCHCQKTYI